MAPRLRRKPELNIYSQSPTGRPYGRPSFLFIMQVIVDDVNGIVYNNKCKEEYTTLKGADENEKGNEVERIARIEK